ncbi:DivIVA domain-containing protein [Solwaraspora sp. WMMA2080]|uniref:DivIVA domain-containing protein n=1 Tax=unclassified Solwaraspora TaxID=2627926 RepID=UPI00248CAFDE|nr:MULTISPECIES: DivIVA domain-containing protein [unclassified Solwaraspora]WBB97585.1 DivIVA domain-containing protein [Solwaraspora sp. WMMA2059]WBC18522.1 DivIVA domain-containing protein [Solwaraspora sp. WMMA2080]
MRELWRRWRMRRQRRRMVSLPPRDWPGGNGVYRVPGNSRNQRPTGYRPIRPWQVRSQHFRSVSGITGRGGLDPADVAAFLDRVAHDLAIVYAELDRTWEQNDRIKDALRRWQSGHAPTASPSGYR